MGKTGFIKRLQQIKTPFFSNEDLKLVFHDRPASAIHSSLSYHLKNQHILKFKRGFYCLAPDDGKFHFSRFNVANALYSPSYVSFESALSYYGLIPEAVFETTSACYRAKHRRFSTPVGVFSYRFIPVIPFFLEVEQDEKAKFLIATPIRALFDLIYLRRRLYSSLSNLEEDFRIEISELSSHLKKYCVHDLIELGEHYKKKTTRTLANLLSEVIKC